MPLLKKKPQFKNLVLCDDNCNDLDSNENISNSFSEEKDFVVCSQFCLNSAINERFYRKQYLTLKKNSKIKDKRIESLKIMLNDSKMRVKSYLNKNIKKINIKKESGTNKFQEKKYFRKN